MQEDKEVRYWIDFDTDSGESIESLRPPTSLKELQVLTNGLPLSSQQATTTLSDFYITVGSKLTLNEKQYKVQRISMSLRDGKTYGEIRVFVIVEEL